MSSCSDLSSIAEPEIVAFGDDYNDVDMLAGSGIGVAMGNAVGKAKTVADYVCLSNAEDGIAKWLEANVL